MGRIHQRLRFPRLCLAGACLKLIGAVFSVWLTCCCLEWGHSSSPRAKIVLRDLLGKASCQRCVLKESWIGNKCGCGLNLASVALCLCWEQKERRQKEPKGASRRNNRLRSLSLSIVADARRPRSAFCPFGRALCVSKHSDASKSASRPAFAELSDHKLYCAHSISKVEVLLYTVVNELI